MKCNANKEQVAYDIYITLAVNVLFNLKNILNVIFITYLFNLFNIFL